MKQVIRQLDNMTRQARRLLVVRRVSTTLSFLIVATLVLVITDWSVRFQSGWRLANLIVLIASTTLLVFIWIIPSIRFRPTRRDVALRIEQHVPELSGRLASGVEFDSTGLARRNRLAAASIGETTERMKRVSIRSLMDVRPAIRSTSILFVLAMIVGLLFILQPTGSSIGFRRVFSPWTLVQWPPRTSVVSQMDSIVPEHGVHGRSIPLVLRAENTTPDDPEGTIEASYRFTSDGTNSEWKRVLLTHQRDGIHERVVPTEGDSIDLRFHSSDSETQLERIRIMEVPEVTSINLTVVAPENTRPWIDDRLIQPANPTSGIEIVQSPVMQGSDISLKMDLNRSIQVPEDPDWINQTLGVNGNSTRFQFEVDEGQSTSWTFHWKADETERMLITLLDEYGLQSDVSIPVHIIVEPDSAPDVVLMKPERDLDVLPTAIIPLSVKVVDDLPLRTIGIEVFRESDQPVLSDTRSSDIEDGRFDSMFDLSESGVFEGDVLKINGMAIDQWINDSGSTRTTRSRSRTVRVVTESEFLSQMRNEMSLIEQRSIDLEKRQSDIRESFGELVRSMQMNGTSFEDLEANTVSSDISRKVQSLEKQQSDITRLVNEQLESTSSIEEWLESNGMFDETMDSVLEQVSEALEDGVRASSQALQSMESMRSRDTESDSDPAEQESRLASEVLQMQTDVQEALQDVVRALSEDQDSWLITRQLDRIRSDQQLLQSETRRLSRELNGQPMERSDADLQSSIQDAARRQQSLLSDLSDLAREMEKQAENTADVDPATSETLNKVMDEARESQIESAMSEASDQIEDGRMQMADASQQQALEALDRMRESMTPDARDRITDLLRRLSDLRQSIQRLVEVQANEIELLEESIATSNFDPRDDAMIELRGMTISTESTISKRTQEEKTIAQRLMKAAEAQANAIGLLRSPSIDSGAVRLQEEISLQQLSEAMEEVDDLQARSEEEMVEAERVELAQLYRDMSETQLKIRNRTNEIIESSESERRRRHESRRISMSQKELAERSDQVRSDNPEIEERPIFILMHDRIQRISREVSDLLSSSTPDESILLDQGRLARDYLAMAEALEDESSDDEEFERRSGSRAQNGGENGSSGGSGQNEVLPPIAELRLLRTLQFDLMESTRLMDRNPIENIEQREDEFRRLSDLQMELAELGQEMFDRHVNESSPEETSTEPVLPPSKWFDDEPNMSVDGNPADREMGIKSLDELLGLDVESSSVDPTPLPANHDPLEAIIDEMERVSILIGTDLNTGPPTQRLQQDILRRIDSLIDQAQEQQSNQRSSQSSSQRSSDQQKSDEEQSQMDQQQTQSQQAITQQSNPQSADSESGSMDAMNPRLGGALYETGREWGSLPERVRELLQQGRKDAYSSVYEKLTGEYYRRIAEQEGGS
ncbi:MAG: hypothetical protein CMJ40_09005 [Phycisphaerae bacterium]|nr:hypothetical protein [Phycisphaerae bacterium]|tara:strand:+ start:3710 stop:7921 length:4212 start_codon:yes stop_codon:yes gene_type:complete